MSEESGKPRSSDRGAVTITEKVARAVLAELERQAAVIDSPVHAVRSIQLVVKVTPAGDPRAVIVSVESERVLQIPGDRPRTFGAPGK